MNESVSLVEKKWLLAQESNLESSEPESGALPIWPASNVGAQ